MGSLAIIRRTWGHRARATNLAATAAGGEAFDEEETAVEPRGTPFPISTPASGIPLAPHQPRPARDAAHPESKNSGNNARARVQMCISSHLAAPIDRRQRNGNGRDKGTPTSSGSPTMVCWPPRHRGRRFSGPSGGRAWRSERRPSRPVWSAPRSGLGRCTCPSEKPLRRESEGPSCPVCGRPQQEYILATGPYRRRSRSSGVVIGGIESLGVMVPCARSPSPPARTCTRCAGQGLARQ
jgi:hypothetical protein